MVSARPHSVRAASHDAQEASGPSGAKPLAGLAITKWKCRRCKARILDYQLLVVALMPGAVVRLKHKCADCNKMNILTLP